MAENLSIFQFEKYDFLHSAKYFSRDGCRTLNIFKEHINRILVNLKKAPQNDSKAKIDYNEKINCVERTIEKIDVGIEEYEAIDVLYTFSAIMDCDKIRTKLQVKRLVQENKWLKSELIDLQKRLVKLEDSVVSAEAEKQHYQYVYKMRVLYKTDDINQYGCAIEIDEDGDTDPEEDIPSKLKAVYNLCIEYITEKRYEVALPLLEEHIVQTKAKTGENNVEMGALYSILGKIQKEQGLYNEAFDYFNKSLTIREKALGKEHDTVGITLTNLAQVEYKRDKCKEAEKYATQALKIREKALNKTHPEVALIKLRLGLYYVCLSKWNDAINNIKAALSVYEQMFDNTDTLMIRAHLNLAKSYLKTKQTKPAGEMLGLICKSYQQKNSNRADANVTVFSRLTGDVNTSVEKIMKEFGSYENVMDKELLDLIMQYFGLIGRKEIVDILKHWTESSDKAPKAVVRQSVINRNSKRDSSINSGISTPVKGNSILRPSGKTSATGKGVMGFFKKGGNNTEGKKSTKK